MQLLSGYAAVLIVIGQFLAVFGIALVVYFTVRQKLRERVRPAKKPQRSGLPYPDLHYWHVLRQRRPIGTRIRHLLSRERSAGI